MGRAGGLVVDGTAEEHLRIGALVGLYKIVFHFEALVAQ